MGGLRCPPPHPLWVTEFWLAPKEVFVAPELTCTKGAVEHFGSTEQARENLCPSPPPPSPGKALRHGRSIQQSTLQCTLHGVPPTETQKRWTFGGPSRGTGQVARDLLGPPTGECPAADGSRPPKAGIVLGLLPTPSSSGTLGLPPPPWQYVPTPARGKERTACDKLVQPTSAPL